MVHLLLTRLRQLRSLHPRSIVEHNLGRSQVAARLLQRVLELGELRHVRRVRLDVCACVLLEHKIAVGGELLLPAGEERKPAEALGGELGGYAAANARTGADDDDGAGWHCIVGICVSEEDWTGENTLCNSCKK